MSEKSNQTHLPVFIGGLVGVAVGLCCVVLSFLKVFGICSDTATAAALFPFSLAADPTLRDRILLALLLALVQYPIYRVVLGYVWRRSRLSKAPVLACAAAIFIGHAIFVGVANYRVKVMWDEKFSHTKY
jgi:hypothetical protein